MTRTRELRREVGAICDRLEVLFVMDAVDMPTRDRPASCEVAQAWLSHIRTRLLPSGVSWEPYVDQDGIERVRRVEA